MMEFRTFVNFLRCAMPPKSYELAVDWWSVDWPGTSGSLSFLRLVARLQRPLRC